MTDESTIAFASNRGPVSFVADDSGWTTKRGAGGLAGALDPVARGLGEEAVWIAAATSDDDRRAIGDGATGELAAELGYRLRLLDIDPTIYERYYDNVSNRMLWFANHCLWDELSIDGFDQAVEDWDGAYEPVNRRFAEAVHSCIGHKALVLFQDYHLSTAPAYLRALRDDATVLHFTHSSFCRPETGLGRLPGRIAERVIAGMLGADLVGLHVDRWGSNFAACCAAMGATVDPSNGTVTSDGATSWVRSYPIPIDAADLIERAGGPAAQGWHSYFREWAGDGRLVVRADRIEPSKNIVRGFLAFGALLDRRPDLAAQVRFAACIYPSRQTMPEYRRYADDVRTAVRSVTERHPGTIKLFEEDDFDRTLGALLAYDVLLVNPIMDGMNLVSKEGPAINTRDGALVLSSGAGSFEELGEAAEVIDDPLDIEETAIALERGLEMAASERKQRAAHLRSAATSQKPADWIEAQLADLRSISDTGEPVSPPPKL
jgi:trehalose 6-phosphate synthase